MKRRNFIGLLLGLPFLLKAKPVQETHTLALSELPKHTLPPVPVGTVQPFAGNNVPAGWLPCDGRVISPQHHPALFEAVGKHYDFRVPDLRAPLMHIVQDDPTLPPGYSGVHGEPVNGAYSIVRYIIKAT